MNKTFMIVFFKARGALMGANEVTSSVQKKGTKVVVAVSSLMALGTADSVVAETVLNAWNDDNPTVSQSLYEIDGATYERIIFGVDIKKSATGTLNNLDITLRGKLAGKEDVSDQQIQGVRNYEYSDVELGGEKLNITVETDFTGTGNNQNAAMEWRGN